MLVLTKADTRTPAEIKKVVAEMKKKNTQVLVVSIIDDVLLKKFKAQLLKILQKS